MMTWATRLIALIVAAVIFMTFLDILPGPSVGLPGRSMGVFTLILIAGVAFIWFPDDASDYLGLSGNSFSGGPGPTLIAISGWGILVIATAIILFIKLQTQ